MINITDKTKCCGCNACVSACPQKCIEMIEDEEGFLYPHVNEEKCIHCGLCQKVCPVLNKAVVSRQPIAYGAYNNLEPELMNSSSGGMFPILAKYVLRAGGGVFGAIFNENFEVVHSLIFKEEDISKIQSSKYVQSRIGDSYKQAKELLNDGKAVLFTGTACQIEGLYKYLGKEYENLITQDIICHGVPSPGVFRKYVKYRESKAGSKIKQLWLRKKTTKWSPYSVIFNFENGTQYKRIYFEDPMMKFFFRHFCLRPICHKCPFKEKFRRSDITLADFWGVKKVDKSIYNKKGTSLVILNSEKGRRVFDEIKNSITYKAVDFEKAISHNPAITRSSKASFRRKGFMKAYKTKSFKRLITKYSTLQI